MTSLVVLSDAPAMTLCAMCPQPGSCCSGFSLYEHGETKTFWKATAEEDAAQWLIEQALPFEIESVSSEWLDEKSGNAYVALRYRCPKLIDGRCSIYELRPVLCRKYLPASDALCVFGVLPEFSDPKSHPTNAEK